MSCGSSALPAVATTEDKDNENEIRKKTDEINLLQTTTADAEDALECTPLKEDTGDI